MCTIFSPRLVPCHVYKAAIHVLAGVHIVHNTQRIIRRYTDTYRLCHRFIFQYIWPSWADELYNIMCWYGE